MIFTAITLIFIAIVIYRYQIVKRNTLTENEEAAVIAAAILYLKKKTPIIQSKEFLSIWGRNAIYQEVTRRRTRENLRTSRKW